MPRYFFDVHDNLEVIDDVGMDWPDAQAARKHARGLVAKFASDPANIGPSSHIVVVTRDGPSSVVSIVRMVCQEEIRAADATQSKADATTGGSLLGFVLGD